MSSAGATAATTLLHPPPGETSWGAERSQPTNAFDAALGSELAKLAATLRGVGSFGSAASPAGVGGAAGAGAGAGGGGGGGGGNAEESSSSAAAAAAAAAQPTTVFGGVGKKDERSAVAEMNTSRSEMLQGLSLLRQELSAHSGDEPDFAGKFYGASSAAAPAAGGAPCPVAEARQESIAAIVDAVLGRGDKDKEKDAEEKDPKKEEAPRAPEKSPPFAADFPTATTTTTPLLTRMQLDLQALSRRVEALETQVAKQVSDPTSALSSLKVPLSDSLSKVEAVMSGSVSGGADKAPLLDLATALVSEVHTRRKDAANANRRFQEMEQTLKSIATQSKPEAFSYGTSDKKFGEASDLAASIKELSESISVERSSRMMQISELRSSLVAELSSRTQVLSDSMTNKIQTQIEVLAEEIQSSLVNTLPPQMLALVTSIGQAQGHDFMNNQLALPAFAEGAAPEEAYAPEWGAQDEGLADPYGLPGHHTMQQNNIAGQQYQGELDGMVINDQQFVGPEMGNMMGAPARSGASHASTGEHDFAGEAELDPYQNSSPRAPGSGDLNNSDGSMEGGNIVNGAWMQPPEQLYDGQQQQHWQQQQQQQEFYDGQQQQQQQVQFQPMPVLQTIYSGPPGNPFNGPIPAQGTEQLQNSVRQLMQKVENRVRLVPVTVMTSAKSSNSGPPPVVQVEGTGTPLRAASVAGTPLAPTRTSTVIAQPVYYRGVSTPAPQTASGTGTPVMRARQVPAGIVTGSPQGGSVSVTPAPASATAALAANTIVRVSSAFEAPLTDRGCRTDSGNVCRRCVDELRKENATLRATLSHDGGSAECHRCHHTLDSTAASSSLFSAGGGSLYVNPTGGAAGVRNSLRSASIPQERVCASPVQIFSVPGSASIR